MTDTEKLEQIARITAIHEDNAADDDGDKYLSQSGYAMEAISAVLNDIDSPILGQFIAAGA